jgi:hypothetical protein
MELRARCEEQAGQPIPSGATHKLLPTHIRRQEVFMSWEQRGSQRYYYRVRYHQGQLTKIYYGTGAVAQRAAAEDDHTRALRKQERLAQQHIQSLETQLTALTNVVRTLVSATLVGHGYHQHQRGDWRRWRHLSIPHQQEGAFAMEEFPLPNESGTSYDTLQGLIQQAQQGDTSILSTIRTLLDQVPELWENSHVLAHQIEKAWTNALSGQDLMSKEIIAREVKGLRSQLLGPQPTPLEKLLVERICICWLAVQHAELHAARRFNERAVVLTPSEEHRLDKVHQRFLSAIRELARVRKLLQPNTNVQVNIAANQTNQIVA